MSESLYFIAITPNQEVEAEIRQFKTEIAEKFGSHHALNSPSHITLHMPFKWKDKRFEELKSVIEKLNEEVNPFEVSLHNFAFFEPRVVYIDVVENEKLRALQASVGQKCKHELKLLNPNYKDQVFRPHVTIGFRDLKKQEFYKAQEYFQSLEYQAAFSVDRISLLKHDGKMWQVHM